MEREKKDTKDTMVMIRLSSEEKEIIEREALKNGLNVSAYIRFILYRNIPELTFSNLFSNLKRRYKK